MLTQMEIKLQCSVCDARIRLAVGKRVVKTPEYREIVVKLNDGSNMKTAVCSRHTKPTRDDLKRITEKTHQGWLEEIKLGVGNVAWINNKGLKLKVVGLVP